MCICAYLRAGSPMSTTRPRHDGRPRAGSEAMFEPMLVEVLCAVSACYLRTRQQEHPDDELDVHARDASAFPNIRVDTTADGPAAAPPRARGLWTKSVATASRRSSAAAGHDCQAGHPND